MAIKEYNVDLDIKGKVLATNVPNSTGSIVTWNATTNVFGLRTNAQIISDLNLSSNFVPYTGATANVNLGARSITSTGGFIGNATTATTATTLATARTINGTSFNGSANITTANWGTARNITIGNTTKSVNGSGNVSWSLAEIGAASSTSLSDYVPYTGASQSIDFNTQKITHRGIVSNVDSITSPWLRQGTSLSTNNKVAYLIIDGFTANTHRQLYIEVESVAGNGEYKRLVKGFIVNFTNTNIIGSTGDSRYLEVTGYENGVRYGIGEVEKHSDTALKIPLIWITSSAQSINKISVKTHTGSVLNLTFSIEYDATSTLTTENPYLYRNASEKWVKDNYDFRAYGLGTDAVTNTGLLENINESGFYAFSTNQQGFSFPRAMIMKRGSQNYGLLFQNSGNKVGFLTADGSVYTAWHSGNLLQSSIDNWNTAYGWGNHADAGYITSIPDSFVTKDNISSSALVTKTIDFDAPGNGASILYAGSNSTNRPNVNGTAGGLLIRGNHTTVGEYQLYFARGENDALLYRNQSGVWNRVASREWSNTNLAQLHHTHVIPEVMGLQGILDGLAFDIYNSLDWDQSSGEGSGASEGLVTKITSPLGSVDVTQKYKKPEVSDIYDVGDYQTLSNVDLYAKASGPYNETSQVWLYRARRTTTGSGQRVKRYTHITSQFNNGFEFDLFPNWQGKPAETMSDPDLITTFKAIDPNDDLGSIALSKQLILSGKQLAELLQAYGKKSGRGKKKVLKLGYRIVDFDRANGALIKGPMTYIDIWQGTAYLGDNSPLPSPLEKIYMKVY